jgi:hypothetical protein
MILRACRNQVYPSFSYLILGFVVCFLLSYAWKVLFFTVSPTSIEWNVYEIMNNFSLSRLNVPRRCIFRCIVQPSSTSILSLSTIRTCSIQTYSFLQSTCLEPTPQKSPSLSRRGHLYWAPLHFHRWLILSLHTNHLFYSTQILNLPRPQSPYSNPFINIPPPPFLKKSLLFKYLCQKTPVLFHADCLILNLPRPAEPLL